MDNVAFSPYSSNLRVSIQSTLAFSTLTVLVPFSLSSRERSSEEKEKTNTVEKAKVEQVETVRLLDKGQNFQGGGPLSIRRSTGVVNVVKVCFPGSDEDGMA
jgi:hypothetical protein